MGGEATRNEVEQQVDAPLLLEQYSPDLVEELVDLITDTLGSTSPTLRIGREELPAAQVQERFRRLDHQHLEYVLDSLGQTTTPIRNIRSYLLTALYNAPATINHYYQAAVQHDLYSDSS